MFTISLLTVICLAILSKSLIIIPERESAIVERLGKYHRKLDPGFYLLIPFIDSVAYRREMREQIFDVSPQHCITNDNIQVEVDGMIYVKIEDPIKASYGIGNYQLAAINMAQTTIRSEIGKLSLHQSFSERESLNHKVVDEISKASKAWGVQVLRYEIMNIIPSKDVVHTLEQAMEAERDRRAEVTLATAEKEATMAISEGKRQEAINLSEGMQQKRINEAEGQAQEITIIAEAMAKGIQEIAKAIDTPKGKDALRMRLVQQYVQELDSILAAAKITVLPMQAATMKSTLEGLAKVTSHF